MKEKNDRDAAIEAIKSGQSVVVDHVQYTMDNLKDLPGIEAFIGDDEKSKSDAVAQLRQEKEALEARLASLESSAKAASKSTTKEPAKDSEAEGK